jgi:signal transduction histidine kinase
LENVASPKALSIANKEGESRMAANIAFATGAHRHGLKIGLRRWLGFGALGAVVVTFFSPARRAVSDGSEMEALRRDLREPHRILAAGKGMFCIDCEGVITDCNDVATQLLCTTDQLVAAINIIPDGFAVFDGRGGLAMCNRRFGGFLGLEQPALRSGMSLVEIVEAIAVAAEDATAFRLSHLAGWLTAPSGSLETCLHDGRWVRFSASAMGRSGMAIMATDISRYKTQERQLDEQAAALALALDKEQEINRLQRDFVSMVSHEFRTPMSVIDATAQRLARRAGTLSADEVIERAATLRAMVRRLTGLIESTMSLSGLDAGTVRHYPQPCRIREMVEAACRHQRDIWPLAEIRLDLGTLPDLIVADRDLLEHALTNLLSNATKYSPETSAVEIVCRADGAWISIAVADCGVGIPETELPQLFNRFFRASTSAGFAGTGIGLYLAQQFLRLHGGCVLVESEVGRGSTFTIRLPLQDCGVETISHEEI